MPTKVLIIAGEASSDNAAAGLLRELKSLIPDGHFYGVGGKKLAAEGLEQLLSAESLNVVGITDWWDKAKDVLVSYRKVLKAIDQRKPDIAILLDLPDFNLRVAKKLKKAGVPVVYYLSPQVWAWRKNRVQQIKERVDAMLVVFPFEKEIYEKAGVPVEFVGHPLVDALQPRKRYRDQAVIQKAPRIALLPGSRKSEVRYHGPILKELSVLIKKNYSEAQIRVPVASTLSRDWVMSRVGLSREELAEDSWEVLHWADIAVVASGTATLETALIGTPFCLFYKVSQASAWIFKNVVKYKGFIGMPNILLGRQVVKECFQENATAAKIFSELKYLINSGPSRLQMVSALLSCRQLLGEKGTHRRAAQMVLNTLNRRLPPPPNGSHGLQAT
ncbi:lipid-A-disaccharide synthase [bacterium]|nr:lipid-A-disaccharide synthase [bacterium]